MAVWRVVIALEFQPVDSVVRWARRCWNWSAGNGDFYPEVEMTTGLAHSNYTSCPRCLTALVPFSLLAAPAVNGSAGTQNVAPQRWWLAGAGNRGPGAYQPIVEPGGNCEGCVQATC